VALVRTDIISVTRIGGLGTTLAVTSNRSTVRSVLRLLVTANVVPNTPILSILMMEGMRSSETSVLARATRRHIPEDGILQIFVELASRDEGNFREFNQ
jgi:hypothetical protein